MENEAEETAMRRKVASRFLRDYWLFLDSAGLPATAALVISFYRSGQCSREISSPVTTQPSALGSSAGSTLPANNEENKSSEILSSPPRISSWFS